METQPERTLVGKYPGTVLQNVDPEQRGRLQLMVPDVLGSVPSTWAEACAPLSGAMGAAMGAYLVPPVGAAVWVEFLGGDPNRPIWVGCRWVASSDVPSMAQAGVPLAPNLVFQTLGQHVVVMSDAPPTPATGGVMLRSAGGATILVNDTGIYIQNGQGASISLVGTTIDFNQGALTVLK